ncbi:hypothetical protein BDR07DRAFT_567652 [Suillus spraguei]|nr:hypothetical protein BDR07DRAFT_567652 [Suillus spraguei]
MVQNTASASDNLQSVSDTIDTYSPILKPLRVFNSIATELADVHPYVKAVLSIFTCASKMILAQAKRDDDVSRLLSKILDVYALLTEGEGLTRIASMLEISGKIARQTLECADFVVHYSDMKSFWQKTWLSTTSCNNFETKCLLPPWKLSTVLLRTWVLAAWNTCLVLDGIPPRNVSQALGKTFYPRSSVGSVARVKMCHVCYGCLARQGKANQPSPIP